LLRAKRNDGFPKLTNEQKSLLQCAALIGSNHHHAPFDGEDFQMFEKGLPRANTAGFNQTSVSKLPLETCETFNRARGHNKNDKDFSVPDPSSTWFVRPGANANFLLLGPMPTGKVQPEFVERLHAVGQWMAKNGDTVYGTRGGPIAPRSWGASTQKGNNIYVRVLDCKGEYLALPELPGDQGSASVRHEGKTGSEGLERWPAAPAAQRHPRSDRHDRGTGTNQGVLVGNHGWLPHAANV
jgi:hypothetical protein